MKVYGTVFERLAEEAGVIVPANYRDRNGNLVYRYSIGVTDRFLVGGYTIKAVVVDNSRGNPDGYAVSDDLYFEIVGSLPRLPHNRPVRVQTMQQPFEGTVFLDSADFATARFLSGRNVFVVTAVSLDGKLEIACTMQVNDFHTWAAEQAAEMAAGNRGAEAITSLGFYYGKVPWLITTIRDDR